MLSELSILNMFANIHICSLVSFFFLKVIYLFIFRERGREREREGNFDLQEKHQSVDTCTPLTGVLAGNPGMCPDGI